MKRSPIRKISDKQKVKLWQWDMITIERIAYLKEKYGIAICEYCGTRGDEYDNGSLFYLRGHHLDSNRSNNEPTNCYICHNKCHLYIHDHNLKVSQGDFQGRV